MRATLPRATSTGNLVVRQKASSAQALPIHLFHEVGRRHESREARQVEVCRNVTTDRTWVTAQRLQRSLGEDCACKLGLNSNVESEGVKFPHLTISLYI
jgi:hypothetical protein